MAVETVAPKFPRLILSPKRHKKLSDEANKRNLSIQEIGEEKFAALEKCQRDIVKKAKED